MNVTPDNKTATIDQVLGGRLSIRQPLKGYRAGLDAALLGACVELAAGERGLEAGSGVGAALLQVAARAPGAQLVGIERDPLAAAFALENVIANGLDDRVRVIQGDIANRFPSFELAPFDSVFANPPFFDDPKALRAPDPAKQGAWMADAGLEGWIGFLLKAVREGGRITLIHRADRLGDILALLAPKAGSFCVRAVHPFADSAAKRVLVRAVKTGKAPMRLLPPLVLRERDPDRHREAADAIFRGEATLGWD